MAANADVIGERTIEARIPSAGHAQFKVQTGRIEKLAAKLGEANDPETRATALELVQSVIELHGAALQNLIDRCVATQDGERVLDETGVHDGIVHLRLHGSCGSCPSSSLTLKNAIEEALYQAAPDIKEIVAENAATAQPAASNLVTIK
jgi:Fe-S cluster biogenesis protein NfuA